MKTFLICGGTHGERGSLERLEQGELHPSSRPEPGHRATVHPASTKVATVAKPIKPVLRHSC